MSIPDPTIDPVTNLPVLNPMDVVQQIPLGVQTFPWQDLDATARPTRSPIYGDDILTVSSFLSGQHPDTGSAQTVETDGAHAAKVRVVNPSSGGGGALVIPANGVVAGGGSLAGGAGLTRISITNTTMTKLAYLQVKCAIEPGALPASENESVGVFYVDNGPDFNGPVLANFPLNWNGGAPNTRPLGQTAFIVFPGSLDLTALLEAGKTYDFYTTGVSIGFSLSVNALFTG